MRILAWATHHLLVVQPGDGMPERVATADIPIPFSPPLEEFVGPTLEKIVAAVRQVRGKRRPAPRTARPRSTR